MEDDTIGINLVNIQQRMTNLDISVVPKRLEIFGDDRTIVIPPRAFTTTEFHQLLSEKYPTAAAINDRSPCMMELWRTIALSHSSSRVVRRKTIDPESKIRESGFRILWSRSSDAAARFPSTISDKDITESLLCGNGTLLFQLPRAL